MKSLKQKVSVSLDGDVREKIQRLAEQEDRSFSQYVNSVLLRHLLMLERQANGQASSFESSLTDNQAVRIFPHGLVAQGNGIRNGVGVW